MNDDHSPMQLNPSTVLFAPMFRVRGGKETHRKPLYDNASPGGKGKRVSVGEVTVIIHDEEEHARAKAIVAEARHSVRRLAVHTIVGYLTEQRAMPEIVSAVTEVRTRGDAFNRKARTCQVEITYLAIPISVALGPEAARMLADHVHDELQALHDALRAGKDMGAGGAKAVLLRVKNLHTLAVGVQSDAIRFAVEEGKTRLSELRAAIKNSESPESAGRCLDLGMIENGIATFTYDATEHDASPLLDMLEG